MQPKYRGDGTPERTGSFSILGALSGIELARLAPRRAPRFGATQAATTWEGG